MTDAALAAVSEMQVFADSQVIYLSCRHCPDSHHFEDLSDPVTVSDIVVAASTHIREAHGG